VPAQEDDVERVATIIDVLPRKEVPAQDARVHAPAADYPSDTPTSELLRTIDASHRHAL
jgi:hypothetical protein